MPTTAEHAQVDVGSLAASIVIEVTQLLAESTVITIEALEDEGRALNQLQKIEMLRNALESVSKLEPSIARTIVNELDHAGVQAWGIDTDLKAILRIEGSDDA